MRAAFTEALQAAHEMLAVEIARHPHQFAEARALRERAGRDRVDTADDAVRHVLVRQSKTGRPVATLHVVPGATAPHALRLTGHLSPFTVSPDRTGLCPSTSALLRLSLFRGVVRVAGESAMTHLRAALDPGLLMLLRATGLHFQPAAPAMALPGARQPSIAAIGPMLDRLRMEHPAAWDYVTDGGRFWPAKAGRRYRPWKAGLRFSMNAVRPSV